MMGARFRFRRKLSSFQIIISGFLGVILLGTLLLALPVASRAHRWTSLETTLFTATSATCVTGLVMEDTATYWSAFGQAVILILIQIGGLGIISVTAFLALASGRKISLLQRSLLQESIAAHQVGGIVRMTAFIFRTAFAIEILGAVLMLPSFCSRYSVSGVWMALFHSVSAFCNAGFDVMGGHTAHYSSLTGFADSPGVVLPICLLIVMGGIGFLTWDDIATNRHHLKRYRMQSKAILTMTAVLIFVPAAMLYLGDFSGYEGGKRILLSLFQAITPRTAGFNTADLALLSHGGQALMIILMLIGGSPGSTAGGMKTTTLAVLLANALSVFRRKKHPEMFGRRIEEQTTRSASALLMLYLSFSLGGAFFISLVDGLPFGLCFFETSSALGTVGLSLGVTEAAGVASHLVLIALMFLGRVGGLTLLFAAVGTNGMELALRPVEKINVG